MKRLIQILLITHVLLGCKKDVPQNVNEQVCSECDCNPIPELIDPNFGYTYVYDSIYKFYPQFNPNSNNEFLYCSFNNTGGVKLNKHNLLTETSTTLYEGVMSYAPSWGNMDWIIFDKGDGQIWKMKSDGDSMELVTNGGLFFHPEFNKIGDLFFTYHGGVDNSTHFNGKIWDLSGVLVDSVDIVATNGDWSLNDKYGFVTGSGNIKIFDFQSGSFSQVIDANYNEPFLGFNWIDSDKAIVTRYDGIYLCDLSSGDLSLIHCGCNSRVYSQGSVSEDGQSILFSETTLTPTAPTTLLSTRRIILMSIDGSELQILNLP